ncbi:MAG: AmmeMemoRadiSam system radical SAM enzyme [Thermoplasmata archaeon]
MREALLWKSNGEKIECQLCAHRCVIASGKTGLCGVRKNESGVLLATTYGKVSSMGPDPIEKKPLYHFMPGTNVYSLGSVGCNFRCDFCQNWSISQEYTTRGLRDVEPEKLPTLANRYQCRSLSWTYNEPTIWFEYTLDGAKLAKTAGLGTSYVTNGYMTEEALREIAPYLDAMNIDVKAFREEFYRKHSKARLQPVLDTCALARELGIHIELTYLVIPKENDGAAEIRNFVKWVHDVLGPKTPVHFSRFHPDYNFHSARSTPMETLRMAHRAAKDEGLDFVYLGNVAHCDEENTYCPKCGMLAMERMGLRLVLNKSRDGKCSECDLLPALR